MNDARPRFPKTDAVFIGHTLKEGIHLVVFGEGRVQVRFCAYLRPDQVVAVNGGWHGGGLAATTHELQQGHLGGGVLQRHPVGVQVGVGFAPPGQLGGLTFGQVGEQDLFRQRQGTAQPLAGPVCALCQPGV